VSCGDIGLLKNNPRSSMAWKSGLKVPLLPVRISCTLQTILLSDLVWCDRLLQIVMVFGALFLNLKRAKQPVVRAAGCHTRPSKLKLKKSAPNYHYNLQQLSHPTGWAALPSENISQRLFQGWRRG